MPGTSEAVDPETPLKTSGLDGSGQGNVATKGVHRNSCVKSESSEAFDLLRRHSRFAQGCNGVG